MFKYEKNSKAMPLQFTVASYISKYKNVHCALYM